MTEITTLEDDLIAAGEDPSGDFECHCCGREHPAFGLQLPVDGPAICTECLIAVQRVATAQAEAQEQDTLAAENPWASDLGMLTKAMRNQRISASRWAVDPMTSPLTEACREEWANYIRALHRITVDFSGPTCVEWPSEPAVLEYM